MERFTIENMKKITKMGYLYPLIFLSRFWPRNVSQTLNSVILSHRDQYNLWYRWEAPQLGLQYQKNLQCRNLKENQPNIALHLNQHHLSDLLFQHMQIWRLLQNDDIEELCYNQDLTICYTASDSNLIRSKTHKMLLVIAKRKGWFSY